MKTGFKENFEPIMDYPGSFAMHHLQRLFGLCLVCCHSWAAAQTPMPDLHLADLQNRSCSIANAQQHTAAVLIFISHECPVTQQYVPLLRQLHGQYQSKGIAFYGIFPKGRYKAGELAAFAGLYGIPFHLLIDRRGKCVDWLKASVVPEVFLLDSGGRVLYSGAIDNRFYAIGKRRPEVTETYLEDALEAVLNRTAIKTNKTAAIGCFIEK